MRSSEAEGARRLQRVRRITDEERQARLAVRHRLAPEARADDVTAATSDIVALHATDAATVYLSAYARLTDPPPDAGIDHALYDERKLVRMLGMRRTMFVVPADLAPVVQAACTDAIAKVERRKFIGHLEQFGVTDDGDKWLPAAQAQTLEALRARGDATAAELREAVPALREQMRVAQGKPYEAVQGTSNRVLSLLAADGRIVRGRPEGSWKSTRYRWAPTGAWLGAELERIPLEEAASVLARRWLRTFGPGTFTDLKWWTGWTAGLLKKVLADIKPAEVELDSGAIAYVLQGDDEPSPSPEPHAALVPALDPVTMGWFERDWYLGPHREILFDRTGNAGPTVWWCGRVVGAWGQRAGGEIALGLLEDVGADARNAIQAEAERLRGWLAERRFAPRFRTPFERELAGATR